MAHQSDLIFSAKTDVQHYSNFNPTFSARFISAQSQMVAKRTQGQLKFVKHIQITDYVLDLQSNDALQ